MRMRRKPTKQRLVKLAEKYAREASKIRFLQEEESNELS